MIAIPWILVSIAGLILVLGIFVVWVMRKGKYKQHETDYKTFFWMGLIWVIIFGGYSIFRPDATFSPLFTIGLVFLLIGAVNRDKWKGS